MSNRTHTLLSGAAATAILVSAAPAIAQDAASSDDDFSFEEIVVTATRRAQGVQDVPYNISAISTASLERAGVGDISDVTSMVPGLVFLDQGPRQTNNSNSLILRGLNVNLQGDGAGTPNPQEPAVSTYLGETPVFFYMKLIDVERVEVLRGPQGTLYGSGSLGGTVRFVPRAPDPADFTWSITADASKTSNSGDLSYEGNVIFNVPLGDTSALRGYFGHETQSGFIDYVNVAERDASGSPVLVDPTDPFSANVLSDHEDVNSADILYGRLSFMTEIGEDNSLTANYFYQKIESGGLQADNAPGGYDEYSLNQRAVFPDAETETHVANLDVEVDLGFARMTSSSSFVDIGQESENETTGFFRQNLAAYYAMVPIDRLNTHRPSVADTEQFTQELRFVSQGDGPVSWTFGGYYLDRKTRSGAFETIPGIVDMTNAALDGTGVVLPGNSIDVYQVDMNLELEDIALFGEVTYQITDSWQVTGGIRAFWQKNNVTITNDFPWLASITSGLYYGGVDSSILNATVSAEEDINEQIFKINTSYDFGEDSMVYFTWSEGFRYGGANGLPLPPHPFGADVTTNMLSYRPDSVTNWELGVKGRMMDGRLNYTVAGFINDWKDIQFQNFTAFGFPFQDNGTKAQTKGFEVELNGSLGENMPFSFGYSYTDATTKDAFGDAIDGEALPGNSKHMVSFAFDYIVEMGDDATLDFHIDGSYRSKFSTAFAAGRFNEDLEGYGLFDVSVTYATDTWNVSLYVDNVFNGRGSSGALGGPGWDPDFDYFFVSRPRTIGLRAKLYSF